MTKIVILFTTAGDLSATQCRLVLVRRDNVMLEIRDTDSLGGARWGPATSGLQNNEDIVERLLALALRVSITVPDQVKRDGDVAIIDLGTVKV